MSKTKKDALESDEIRLLREGVRSYFDALVAITAFRHEVSKKCRKVIEDQLVNINKAWGEKIAPDAIEDYEWPGKEPWEGDYLFVGVAIKNAFPDHRWIGLYYGLFWEQEDEKPSFGVETSVWVRTKRAKRLLQTIQQARQRTDYQCFQAEENVGITTILSEDQITSFESILEEHVNEWSRIGKGSGGILKILDRDS